MAHELQVKNKGLKKLESFINGLEDKSSSLIKVLYEAQHIFGYLPKDVILFIGEALNIPASKVYGVVSFYSYFTLEPKGRSQIKVCMGTACFVRGAEKIAKGLESQLHLKMGETSADREFSLEALRCVGACGLAPVVMVNDTVHGKVSIDDISTIIHDCKK